MGVRKRWAYASDGCNHDQIGLGPPRASDGTDQAMGIGKQWMRSCADRPPLSVSKRREYAGDGCRQAMGFIKGGSASALHNHATSVSRRWVQAYDGCNHARIGLRPA